MPIRQRSADRSGSNKLLFFKGYSFTGDRSALMHTGMGDEVSSIRCSLEANGYALVRKCRPSTSTSALAEEIGSVISLEGYANVQQLVPRAEAARNTYSGIFGLKAFPFHTDGAQRLCPPRYLMLRCVKGYQGVSTLLLDGRRIVEKVGQILLSRAIVKPRRSVSRQSRLLRIYQNQCNQTFLRWDQVFLIPASAVGQAAFERFSQSLESETPRSIELTTAGDTLIIDNWRMLHARSAVPPDCQERVVERIYLESLS